MVPLIVLAHDHVGGEWREDLSRQVAVTPLDTTRRVASGSICRHSG